jgi:hypothetical protein
MQYDATYKVNGRTYGFCQTYKNTWFWECGDCDKTGFTSFEEALNSAKEHSQYPLSRLPQKNYGSSENQVNDYWKSTRL